MTRAETGRRGEDLAAAYYEKHGCTVVARNVHARCGELDLVAENEALLIFAEVKTRAPGALTQPREAVDLRKQQKIVKTALVYLQRHPTDKQPRFDVVEVYLAPGTTPKLRCIPAAFDASCLDADESW